MVTENNTPNKNREVWSARSLDGAFECSIQGFGLFDAINGFMLGDFTQCGMRLAGRYWKRPLTITGNRQVVYGPKP